MPERDNTPVIAEGLSITFRDQTVQRDPETFNNSFLIGYDFDGTCFATFTSTGGPNVNEAYEIAITEVLGPRAVQAFIDAGGIHNRAPSDIIHELVISDPSHVDHALDHAIQHFAQPEAIGDIGLDMVARFADRNIIKPDELTMRAITEMLVMRKKTVLFSCINTEWPKPIGGFYEHWEDLHTRKIGEDEWRQVNLAIVSSAHTDFIRKVLEVSGLPQPDVYMTDDEMRRQVHPRTKPDPFALELAREAWLNAYAVPTDLRVSEPFMQAVKARQVYIGDDPEKDGKMAINDNIKFIHQDGQPDTWGMIGKQLVKAISDRVGFNAK